MTLDKTKNLGEPRCVLGSSSALYTFYWNYMRTICFENTNVTHPGWVFGQAEQCTLFIGIICGPHVYNLEQM